MAIERRWTDQQRQVAVLWITRAWAEIRHEIGFMHTAHELVQIIDLLSGPDTVVVSHTVGQVKPAAHIREELIQQMFDLFFAPGRLNEDGRPSSFHQFQSASELDEFLREDETKDFFLTRDED